MNENSNDNQETPVVTETVDAVGTADLVQEAQDAVKVLSADELALLQLVTQRMTSGDFKSRMRGLPKLTPQVKLDRYWFNGNLIDKAEHDKLSWAEVHANNNVVKRAK